MPDSISTKNKFQWSVYLLQLSLDPLFSGLLTAFLQRFEKEWATHFDNVPYELCQLESGNRLRPVIAFLGYLVSGNELTVDDFAKIVKVGVCIELIHKSSVIIDDIVDGDTLRNGKTTFHVANGQEKAIAVASHLISKSFRLLMDALSGVNFSQGTSLRCLEISINILNDMSTGLLKELSMDSVDFSNVKLTEEIIRYEAASIIKNSLLFGYILRGGDNDLIINYLNEIGESFGYIFQVMNDIEPYRNGTQYKSHKGKNELEFFYDRKNIITSFILQLINSKEKEEFHLIRETIEVQAKLFEYFNRYCVYDHFIFEIEEIKKNMALMIDKINKEGVDNQWSLNFKNFINSLVEVALLRFS